MVVVTEPSLGTILRSMLGRGGRALNTCEASGTCLHVGAMLGISDTLFEAKFNELDKMVAFGSVSQICSLRMQVRETCLRRKHILDEIDHSELVEGGPAADNERDNFQCRCQMLQRKQRTRSSERLD